jgi:hypothetical protein
MVIGLASLFLSAQAFACDAARSDRDVGSLSQQTYSMDDQSSYSDQDLNNQGNSNSDNSLDQTQPDQPETIDQ